MKEGSESCSLKACENKTDHQHDHNHKENHKHEHDCNHSHSHDHDHEESIIAKIFDEKLLMGIAILGAVILGKYLEAVSVLVLYLIGEKFEDIAVEKARDNISELMDIRPDTANILGENGELTEIDPALLKQGDIIYVRGGEKVPVDGTLLSETGKFDTSALTGESKVRELKSGDEVLSGTINVSASNREILEDMNAGILKIKVEKEFGESTASKILDLMENASERKAKSENFITKFARIYTPIVCGLALLLAVIPSVVTGEWSIWIYRALTFLVISCPCALVISVPLGFFAGLGGASKEGILIKGSNYMETLSKVDTVVFDKTGTLTVGNVNKEDELKPTSKEAIKALKKLGIRYTIMLTGDYSDAAESIGKEAGLDKVYSELLPEDKLKIVENLIEEKQGRGTLCYAGDGVNDAPVLVRSDIGIAMGAMGSDAAVEAADVVLMDDDPLKIPKAIKIAKKCIGIVRQNIVFAIGVKVICLILGAFGIANMWMAIFADVGVMILAVLNAIRALNVKNL